MYLDVRLPFPHQFKSLYLLTKTMYEKGNNYSWELVTDYLYWEDNSCTCNKINFKFQNNI